MNILGINLEKTEYGLELSDGGACLIIDGVIHSMIAEERLSREKHDSGYTQSIPAVLENANLTLTDVDLIVASSCLEEKRTPRSVQVELAENGFDFPLEIIEVCDHHLSHAYSAYHPSGFDEAIVIVADGDGNAQSELVDGTDETNYWKNAFDHQSYYVANQKGITLLEKDDVPIGENGLGGAYRYLTYFCGFPGNKFAGKLMGLSAYGKERNALSHISLFHLDDANNIRCNLPDSNRLESQEVVQKWLAEQGANITPQPFKCSTYSHEIVDVAWFVQRELQEILVKKINYLIAKTGIKNICIAGGVGLNAVANQYIKDNCDIDEIFIQPASGDSGQCLGNALYGAVQEEELIRDEFSVYLGPQYIEEQIHDALVANNDQITFEKKTRCEIIAHAADSVKNNKIIAWFTGRSEIGPRALGHRSILANPSNPDMKDIINSRIKHREYFRPFAPSVIASEQSEWFDGSLSPHMILNATVKNDLIPAVTHVDGSSRLQSVTGGKYHELLTQINQVTGVPIVINTSFNDNEPIVETPNDAIHTFVRTKIDVLYLENYIVRKLK